MATYLKKGLFEALEGGAFKAKNAVLTGDVTLGKDVGIWFGCVVRGDDAELVIGARTNVQDLTIIHADIDVPNVIGEEVTIGHRCVLHGAHVGNGCLIGMGAVLLAGSVVGSGSIVAAGAVLRENFEVPPGSLVAGVPARVIRDVTEKEREGISASSVGYVKKIRQYL